MLSREFTLRYRAFTWPSLRHQRLWALLPAAGAVVSIVLFCETRADGPRRMRLCDEAAVVLGRSDLGDANRVAFDRARYLSDKAGCDVLRAEELRRRR